MGSSSVRRPKKIMMKKKRTAGRTSKQTYLPDNIRIREYQIVSHACNAFAIVASE